MTTTALLTGARPAQLHEPVQQPTAIRPEHAARLRQLVGEQHDFLWRQLRRLGVPASDVDDALQTVFVIANEKLSLIDVGRERAYLFGIAVRVASNARRSESRKHRVFDSEPLDDQAIAVERHDIVEMRDLLEHALEPLSIELRMVFVLFEFEEMTAPEIADFVGVPVGTVASRLRRARELFSQRAEQLRATLRAGETP